MARSSTATSTAAAGAVGERGKREVVQAVEE